MNKTAFTLLITAGILMLLAGGIFAFIKLWLYAAMLGAGALCCLAAAINFKNRSRDEEKPVYGGQYEQI